MKSVLPIVAAAALVIPGSAFAWGGFGHRWVGEAAVAALPPELPAFLRNPEAVADIGELSREQDRSKGSGRIHDHNRDAGHFVDLDEAGKLLGGPSFLPLPPTRADYEKGLQAAGLDSWKAGYLQYSIIDQHQQLVKDFGYWRASTAAARFEKDKARRAWFTVDAARRQAQILQTIGHLSHFVGDGSQPLHVTVHYNGWGDYPNPNGYTTARFHGPFEEDFVAANLKFADVQAGLAPFRSCNCPIEQRTTDYLMATSRFVEPLYALEKAGGFTNGDARGVRFATERMAAGASELRDHIVEAWRASGTVKVGWPAVSVADFEAGTANAWDSLYGRN